MWSVSVKDPHQMKDLVTLIEDVAGVGRMVVLNTNQTVDSGEVELLSCPLHCTNTAGLGDKRVWEGLREILWLVRRL